MNQTLITENKPILILTGTSRGLGRDLVSHFIEKGYLVVGCSRGESDLKLDHYFHFQVDLTDEQQVRVFVRTVKKQFKKIDVLVCNAGLVGSALLMPVTSADLLNSFINSNFVSAYLIAREVSKVMLLQNSGRIIAISSILCDIHEPGTSAYTATKAAVVEMIKVMARELVKHNITCNVVAPSLMVSESSSSMGDEWKQKMLEKQTVQRIVQTKELCHAISFFADPLSGAITGQVVRLALVD